MQSEPYRLFFPLGLVMGMVGVSHWLFYGLGWSQEYSGFYHFAVQIWLYMGGFAGGFLMTAIPRFSDTPVASRVEVASFLLLMFFTFYFLLIQHWAFAAACFIVWLFRLAWFVVKRFLKRQIADPPTEFVWVPIAFAHGIAGTLLIFLSQVITMPAGTMEMGKSMGSQGFLLSLVLGIGGYLGPRLMGIGGPLPSIKKEEVSSHRYFKIVFYVASGVFLFLTFCFPESPENLWAHFLRAALVTSILIFTKALSWEWPRPKGFFSKLVWISFWMVAAGLWLAPLFPKYRVAMLHFVFIVGFSLLTFSVATMVVLSHSGQGERLQRSPWILWVLAFGIFSALALRIAAQFFGDHYFGLLAVAAALWLVTAGSWIFYSLPFIFRRV